MDQNILVKDAITPGMIAAGKRVLRYLDEADVEIKAALWLFTGEYSTCRLVLAMPLVKEAGSMAAYERIQTVLRNAPHAKIELDDIHVIDDQEALEAVSRESAYHDSYIYRLPEFYDCIP